MFSLIPEMMSMQIRNLQMILPPVVVYPKSKSIDRGEY